MPEVSRFYGIGIRFFFEIIPRLIFTRSTVNLRQSLRSTLGGFKRGIFPTRLYIW